MNGDKEFTEMVEKTLKKHAEIFKVSFGELEKLSELKFSQAKKLSEFLDFVESDYKKAKNHEVNKKHLEFFTSVIAYQSMLLKDLASLNTMILEEIKFDVSMSFKISLYTTRLIFEGFTPKPDSRIIEKLDILEKEVNKLRGRKVKIRIEAEKNITETLEKFQKMLDEAKKAREQYIV